jgi:hypothetical protein
LRDRSADFQQTGANALTDESRALRQLDEISALSAAGGRRRRRQRVARDLHIDNLTAAEGDVLTIEIV